MFGLPVVGGGGGGVVASLTSPSMLPLSLQTIGSCESGWGVQPSGTLHWGPAWFSVNC
jgi:hypothetical protein